MNSRKMEISRTRGRSDLFWAVLVVFGITAVAIGLVPGTQNVGAQKASTPCMDLKDRIETGEKNVVRLATYVDIKISLDLWQEKAAKIDRAIAANEISGEADSVCRLLACTADGDATDPESRMKFQRSVRDALVRAIHDVLKADAAKLSEDLASARKDLAAARAEISKRGCDNIQVISATYGGNCRAPLGNQTSTLMKECDGKESCTYRVDYTTLTDPAYGCEKDYSASWRCGFEGQIYTVTVPPQPGSGPSILLSCEK